MVIASGSPCIPKEKAHCPRKTTCFLGPAEGSARLTEGLSIFSFLREITLTIENLMLRAIKVPSCSDCSLAQKGKQPGLGFGETQKALTSIAESDRTWSHLFPRRMLLGKYITLGPFLTQPEPPVLEHLFSLLSF